MRTETAHHLVIKFNHRAEPPAGTNQGRGVNALVLNLAKFDDHVAPDTVVPRVGLYDQDMKRLSLFLLPLLAVGVLAAGCNSSGSVSVDLQGRSFIADSITVDGTSAPAAQGSQIALTFTDTGIAVVAGCNTMIGVATLTADTVVVAEPGLVSTMMACADTLMAQDQYLSEFFAASPSYTLAGSTLTLSSGATEIVMAQQ